MSSVILVVESDDAIRAVIRDQLQGRGYRVTVASRLEAVSDALGGVRPDLALVGCELAPDGPGSLGPEMARLGAAGPFILLVEAGADDPVALAVESGALTYVKRPVDRSRLLMAVHQGVAFGRLAARAGSGKTGRDRTRSLLRGMVSAGEGGLAVLDADGVVVECGGRAGGLLFPDSGLKPGVEYLSVLPESARELHRGVIDQARETRSPARIEEHGAGAVVETVVSPVIHQGRPTGYIVARRDISARRRSETGLAESEKQYRSVFEGADEAVILVDRTTGLILASNPAAARSLGYNEERLSGAHVEDMLVRPASILSGLRKGVERIAYEYLRRRDGSTFPVEISLSYFTSSGREVAILYVQDVSRRKIVEEALREGARLYRAVVEDQTELICRYGPDARLTFVNGAYARFFGEDEDEVEGRDCFAHFEPDDRRRFMEWLSRANPSEPVLDAEVRLVRADGRERWIQWTSRAVLDERRAVTEIQAVGRDVTKRKEAERALEAANVEKEQYRLNLVATFKSIPDAILTVDTDLIIMASNNAAATLFAFDKGRMRGLRLEDVITGEGNPCVGVLKQVLRTEKPVRGYEIELATPSLGQRMVELNCAPLVGQDKRHAGAVLVVRDVSRVADLERKLQQRHGFRGIVGSSPAMQDVYGLLEQLSSLESIVLILGESGTGKELVAEALHYGGVRAAKPLIKVNCSALSENLLESELFGHVKGAFTGAVRDKVGRIQAAQGGTLFLDEIGDISPLIQLKLLRFLEQKEYERVGDTRTQSADVRIIAATNVDLREAVRQGTFREDLYYRLNVMPVHLPPLRERKADIPRLVDHFLDGFSDQFGKSFNAVSEEVMDLFMDYRWPGNVRELRHALEHACILSPGGSVTLKHIRKDLVEQAYARQSYPISPDSPPGAAQCPSPTSVPGKPGKDAVMAVLAECGGNKVRAARRLGIHRATLYRKLKAWEAEG